MIRRYGSLLTLALMPILLFAITQTVRPVAAQMSGPTSPPRPASSYLHGPFVAVNIALEIRYVTWTRNGPISSTSRVVHTTLLDRVAIGRLVSAVDSIHRTTSLLIP